MRLLPLARVGRPWPDFASTRSLFATLRMLRVWEISVHVLVRCILVGIMQLVVAVVSKGKPYKYKQ